MNTFSFPSSVHVGSLVLAAGKGTRMYSDLPKVLQPLLHQPMLRYVLQAAHAVCGEQVWTIIGHKASLLEAAFPEEKRCFVVQEQQLGTGHALQTGWALLEHAGLTHVLVINGDTPLLTPDILWQFVSQSIAEESDISFISLSLENPGAFGRVVRSSGAVTAVIEAKDYNEALYGPEPNEINAGIYCLRLAAMKPLLHQLTNGNKSGEYYITDLIGLAVAASLRVAAVNMGDTPALLGVNTPAELVRSEELLRDAIVQKHLQNGVRIHQGSSVRLGPDVLLEKGVSLTGPCELYGNTSVGRGSIIESHCVLYDTQLEENVHVRHFCHFEKARVGTGTVLGPYARLRPEAHLEDNVHIGNFVEVKKSLVHQGAKVNHLTYIGDAEIGEGSNIGAGTITCNYDGKNKFKTTIGKKAFIGSNTALVAPVTIGDNALVGAGSVITKDVPDNALAIARGKQANLPRRK